MEKGNCQLNAKSNNEELRCCKKIEFFA